MARHSLLTPPDIEPPKEETAAPTAAPKQKVRAGLMHVGGYYDPNDPLIIEFAKLGIDLRQTKQEMLLEAIRDFVAKHKAAQAFR